jgi:hypothetical protein
MRARSTDASGVWDWTFRSTNEAGDVRLEQEEWHLTQRGDQIEGYYDRAVTIQSTDGRPFRCNQKLGFATTTRVRIAGRAEDEHVQLREISFEVPPSPCDDGARTLVSYDGSFKNGMLALSWGPDAIQTLTRRVDRAVESSRREQGAWPGGQSTPLRAPLDGRWVWELRSIDSDGDERIEYEDWHLSETTDGIRGYYDRTVRRVRAKGIFQCNGKPAVEASTRYTITGQRIGDHLHLTELDYKATPSRCDNALRRLDSYQGEMPDVDRLLLSWGPGNQLLRRHP